MAPINIKPWWLAAVAATSVLPPAWVHAAVGDKVGVVSAAREAALEMPQERIIHVGNDVTFGEQIRTDARGAVHLLFSDRSSLTLGPNSTLTIDRYSYRPDQQQGNLAVSLTRGLLRVVGGAVSKLGETKVSTQNGTLGIRGGIALIDVSADKTRGTFVFGEQLQATSQDGKVQKIVLRPGFFVDLQNQDISEPQRLSANEFAMLLNVMESRETQRAADDLPLLRGQHLHQDGDAVVDRIELPGIDPDRLDQVIRDINYRDPAKIFSDIQDFGVDVYQS